MNVSGINDRIRFYSEMLCTTAINTSNTTRTQTSVFLLVAFYCTALICNYCFLLWLIKYLFIYPSVCLSVCWLQP